MPVPPVAGYINPYGPQIGFQTEQVLPPSAYYISPDDEIVTAVLTDAPGITLFLQLRLLTPQGELKVSVYQFPAPLLNQLQEAFTIPPSEGYLLGLMVWAVEPDRGRCFIQTNLVRGNVGTQLNAGLVLVQGYVNTQNVLAYPTSQLEPSLNGQGALVTLQTTTTPGADWSFTVPPLTRWRVASILAVLAPSAAAGNRTPYVEVFDQGAVLVLRLPPFLSLAANSAAAIQWAPGFHNQSSGADVVIGLPDPLLLSAGFKLSSVTAGMQPGDQWQSIALQVEEWLGH